MIKEMKGWKVIKSGSRASARASNWWTYSRDHVLNNELQKWLIVYPVNVEVFPKVKGSKLFFFETETQAYSFADYDEFVVPCIAKGVTGIKTIAEAIPLVKDFWKRRVCKKSLKEISPADLKVPPKGTLVAESITCLE